MWIILLFAFNSTHAANITTDSLFRFKNFREKNFLTDFTLISKDNVEYHCHKLVLASYSDYFVKMFEHNLKENNQNLLYFNYTSKTLSTILDFIYEPGKTELKNINVDFNLYLELLEFSDMTFSSKLKEALRKIELEISAKDLVYWFNFAIKKKDVDLLLEIFTKEGSQALSNPHTLHGHTAQVLSALFSPNGKQIVTAAQDNTAIVWDAHNKKKVITLRGHSGNVLTAAFSPDGLYIVTASRDTTAKIWDAKDGREILTLKGHSDGVLSATFSPNGLFILTASDDNTAGLWNVHDGKKILTLGHTRRVGSAAFSPDGALIVTSSWDQTAKVWDSSTGKEILTLNGHLGYVRSAAFSPNGLHIVTASKDNTAKIWEARSGKEILTLKGHNNWVRSAAFSPDGLHIVTASKDNTAKVWDASTGQEILTLKGHNDWVKSAVFSPDKISILTSSDDETVKIWAMPPFELASLGVLLDSSDPLRWLLLRYQLENYFQMLKSSKEPSFIEFISEDFVGNESCNDIIKILCKKSQSLKKYLKFLFEDFIE